jgi:patatin-like phospholipase/acyl hydrolase
MAFEIQSLCDETSRQEKRFQILSLSGGGYLGLYTICVLADMEHRIGAPLATRFDLIAGTSVGGIIAIGIANEVPAAHIKEAFEGNGTKIFSARHPPKTAAGKFFDVLRCAIKPKYDPRALRDTIIGIIGADTRIGDLKHPCVIPTVCLTKGGPQIFKTSHHPDFSHDLRLKAVDVALATAAAPSYFPIAEIEDGLYADGGLYANSPDLIALHEAEHFFRADIASIRMLSVGTTTSKFSFAHDTGTRFGLLQWTMGQRLVQAILSSQQQIVDNVARHRLGSRYVRLDAEQSREQERALSIDTAHPDAQKTIRAMAAVTAQTALANPDLAPFLSHISAPPEFFHRPALQEA